MEKKNKINTEVKVENESNLLTDEELGQAQGGIAVMRISKREIKDAGSDGVTREIKL